MKKLSLLLIVILGVITLQSCKKDRKSGDQQANISDDEAKAVVESSVTTDGLFDMVDVYAFGSTTTNRSQQLPSCVTQTITRNGTSVVIVWEFDANGCTMPNGNTYKGTVTITRDWDMAAHSVSGSIAFDNFYVNDVNIEGSADFTRELNTNGNPQVTHNYDFTLNFPNGDTAVRSGVRTREWVEGFGTPSRTDDVFLVTGNAHIERRNGIVLDAVITNPLRREVPCRFFVSGTIEITKNNHTATLDFGNGACDAEATLTLPDGTVRIIHL
jgi:hypothetical protein